MKRVHELTGLIPSFPHVVGRELLQHFPSAPRTRKLQDMRGLTVGWVHRQWEGHGVGDTTVGKRGGPLGLEVLFWVSQNLRIDGYFPFFLIKFSKES